MKKIIIILIMMLLITVAGPILHGRLINNPKILKKGDSEPGMINPEWIIHKADYESFDDFRVYEDYVYVCGSKWDPIEEIKFSMVYKIDSTDGNLIWKIPLSLFDNSTESYDIEVFNQGIYVVGFVEDFQGPTYDSYICKLNFDGEILWNKIITEESQNHLYSISSYNDYLYICGIGKINVHPNPRLIKLDHEGNFIFDKNYDEIRGYLHNIKIYHDNIYCIGQADRNHQDFLLMKFDLDGNLIWHQIWGESNAELGIDIDISEDYIYAYGYGGRRDHFLKYDHDGVLQWQTNSGLYINGLDVVVHEGYAYTTGTMFTSNKYWEVVLCKYDLDSNMISYLIGPYSHSGRDLEIYDGYLYQSSTGYILKYDLNQNLDNQKPNKPSRPQGPNKILRIFEYDYTTTSSDPDDDQVSYDFSWGDGTYSSMRWYESEEQATASHKWLEKGNFEIKVRSRDEYGMVSEWSDPLKISSPRTRINPNSAFVQMIKILQQIFPGFSIF